MLCVFYHHKKKKRQDRPAVLIHSCVEQPRGPKVSNAKSLWIFDIILFCSNKNVLRCTFIGFASFLEL